MTIVEVWDMVFPNMEKGYFDQPDNIDHGALRERIQELLKAEEKHASLSKKLQEVKKLFR